LIELKDDITVRNYVTENDLKIRMVSLLAKFDEMKHILKRVSESSEVNDEFIKSVYSVQVKETINLQSKIDGLIEDELKILYKDEN
jgi:hypothetical protein